MPMVYKFLNEKSSGKKGSGAAKLANKFGTK